MDRLQTIKKLIDKGFHLGLLPKNKKAPPEFGWQQKTTNNFMEFEKRYKEAGEPNILIDTGKFADPENKYLIAVDIDNKNGKNGFETLLRLELEGKILPQTFWQETPTGGRHLVFKSPVPVGQNASKIGEGIDIRGLGGYIVGATSIIDGKVYVLNDAAVERAPDWLIEACGRIKEKTLTVKKLEGINEDRAYERAKYYLENESKYSVQGMGGDHTAFATAAAVRDFGVNEQDCYELLSEFWNPKCEPPWTEEELKQKVFNAYRYSKNPQGIYAPETQFEKIEEEKEEVKNPLRLLEKEYSFVLIGGKAHILREVDGQSQFLDVNSFKLYWSGENILLDGDTKPKSITKVWLEGRAINRKTYDHYVFNPKNDSPKNHYNIFQGFPVKPAINTNPKATQGVDMLLGHIYQNLSDGNKELGEYLITHTAHLFQKPWEKPGVATVFRGSKGTGKSLWSSIVAKLCGRYSKVIHERRHLLGNFNSALENALYVVLEEAYWSGDKAAEGVLKHLITGTSLIIERKGFEPYEMQNYTRLHVNTNADWAVPASNDERRFAVYDVNDNKKQDIAYFTSIMNRMESGGYEKLMGFLLAWDINKINIRVAPESKGKTNQILESLDVTGKWWFSSLKEGKLAELPFELEWGKSISTSALRDAVLKFSKSLNHHGYIPHVETIGKKIRDMCPSIRGDRHIENNIRKRVCVLPPLDVARAEFEHYVRGPIDWDGV